MNITFKKLDYNEVKKFSNLWSTEKSIREICLHSSSQKKVYDDGNLIGFYFCDADKDYSVTKSWYMNPTTRFFITKDLSQYFILKPFKHQNKWIVEEINRVKNKDNKKNENTN